MPAPRSVALRRAWAAVYNIYRRDPEYDKYNRTHNRYFEINNLRFSGVYKKLK
jgi:hypothetical protein